MNWLHGEVRNAIAAIVVPAVIILTFVSCGSVIRENKTNLYRACLKENQIRTVDETLKLCEAVKP